MTDRPMTSYDIPEDVINQLGLPERTKWFTLHVASGEMITITCMYYPKKFDPEILKIFEVKKSEYINPENCIGGI